MVGFVNICVNIIWFSPIEIVLRTQGVNLKVFNHSSHVIIGSPTPHNEYLTTRTGSPTT